MRNFLAYITLLIVITCIIFIMAQFNTSITFIISVVLAVCLIAFNICWIALIIEDFMLTRKATKNKDTKH